MRSRGALWRVAATVGWAGALIGILALAARHGTSFLVAEVPLTFATGALVDRWWVTAAPTAFTAIVFALQYATDPSCSDCGEDPYSLQLMLTAVFFIAPATTLLAGGVGARRLARHRRRLDSGTGRGSA
jgi:hypothetical protein